MIALPRILLLAVMPLLPVSPALAQSDPQALQLLQRVHNATQKLSYSGIFHYQYGDVTETSRIARLVDGAGAHEKVETLSGSPREIIRSRNQVTCYLPDSMTVRIDKQVADRSFPAILPGQIRDLSENYVIRKGEVERVAGYDCQVIVLTPKDKMRYGHRLWADVATGMLLKAKTFDERNSPVETFEFVQLQLGNVDRDKLRSRFAGKGREWRVEDSGAKEANLAGAGWDLRAPPGFRKIGEMRRTLGGTAGVGHIVLSDGLAAVSVFIEPLAGRTTASGGFARQGAVNVYTRRLGDHWITVVGETPAESVRYVANAVEYRKPQ
jgi:sigma-E factor negative regulatory protein RseB